MKTGWVQNPGKRVLRIREELGYDEILPREKAIAQTVAWEKAHPLEKYDEGMFDYAAEDAALASWRTAEG